MGLFFKVIGIVFFLTLTSILSGCGKTSPLADFRFIQSNLSSSSTTSWSDATLISNGSNVNDERSTSTCRWLAGVGMLAGGSQGCMQAPALVHTGSQWVAGFPQVNTANLNYFSIFSNLTSAVTGIFGTPAAIDIATEQNARYVKFAKLPNGDLIAVYWLELAGGVFRDVYANVFNSSTGAWGTGVLLSTGSVPTDFGTDGLDTNQNFAILCRPAIGVSGDGTAMIAWCEEAAAAPDSQIKYRTYSGGSWTPAIGSAPTALASTADKFFPGFTARTFSFEGYFTGSMDPAVLPDYVTISVTKKSYVEPTYGVTTYYLKLKATDGIPSTREFKIARDTSSNILMCDTLKNLGQALVANKTTDATYATEYNVTLSQLGASYELDPDCNTLSASCAVGGTDNCKISLYLNKNLTGEFRDNTTAADVNYSTIATMAYTSQSALNTISTLDAATTFENTSTYGWQKSAMVDVAGDAYGNFALVRSVVSPFFKLTGITSADVDYGRMLVGHEYSTATGWRSISATNTMLSTKKVSSVPACLGATDYSACSVRNPKMLMSNNGKGLALFYKNQPVPYITSSFATRLWYSTYSTTSSYSSSAQILDEDTYCSTSSVANDVPVCETGSHSSACQTLAESQNTTLGLQLVYPSATTLDHDVPPIAAAMNEGGKAIVAYHKMANTGTTASPVCTYYGTYVKIYDPTTGFGSSTRLDAGLGNTMHAQVAINTAGVGGVVWEEVRSSAVYVYFRKYDNGTWSSVSEVVASTTTDTDSMMPTISVNDSDEIIVSYSLGKYTALASSSRHQYVRTYLK